MHKDSNINQTTNGELTPDAIEKAFENLPSNYVVETQKVLKKLKSEGKIEKTYSDRYIQKVKSGESDNQDILLALLTVGENNMNNKKLFAFRNKKTPSAT